MAKRNILIVDDESDVTFLFSKFLQKKGYDTMVAGNALEALRVCRTANVDLILSDYSMPEMSGKDLLVELRRFNQEIPVILMSGRADMRTAVDAIQNDAFDFLAKPVDSSDLLQTLRRAFERREQMEDDERAVGATVYMGPIVHTVVDAAKEISVLQLNRSLDETAEKKFDAGIRKLLTENEIKRNCIVSLKHVRYINNVGLTFLLDLFKKLQAAGRSVRLTDLQDSVHRYLSPLGYLDYFQYFSTQMGAINSFDKR